METKAHRLLLIDDRMPFRQGAARLLMGEGRWDVVADAPLRPEVVELVRRCQPHIALLDTSMPGLLPFQILREIACLQSRRTVVALASSAHDDRLRETLRLGAVGCVPKTADFGVFLQALAAVLKGEVAIPRFLTGRLLSSFQDVRGQGPRTRR